MFSATEIPNPSTDGPKAMVACVAIGLFTSLVFIIVLLFVSQSMTAIIKSAYGPLLQILHDATSNQAGAICLVLYVVSTL